MRVADVGRVVETLGAGKLRSVETLNAVGRSLQVAEVGRVIECSWMIVAGN